MSHAAPPTQVHDFIVVGSGPAGATLASRLARSPKAPTVLLLEAGGASKSQSGWMGDRFTSFADPSGNWGYQTVPQQHLNNRIIDFSRGRSLGGTSNINFACYTIGPRDDYDRWADLVGDDAFNWEHSVRKRKNIESYLGMVDDRYSKYYRPTSEHGTQGPLHVGVPDRWEDGMTEVLDAAEEAGLGICPDINSGEGFGMGVVPATAFKHHRATAATAYLSDVPDNLTIITDAPVSKVLFDGNRAVGVVSGGREYFASKDVVLSAGAVDSPKLLMLSGIGDAEELSAFGIESKVNLPGIGKGLQDHLMFFMYFRQKDGTTSRSTYLTNAQGVEDARKEFAEHATGPLSVVFNSLAMGFFRNDAVLSTPEAKELPQEMQDHLHKPTIPIWEMAAHCPVLTPAANPDHSYLVLTGWGMNPQSRGTIKLASADPAVAPLADPNYLSHPFDRIAAAAAGRKLIEFTKTPALARDIIEQLTPPASESDADILAYIKDCGMTTWHPSCTVKMGKSGDADACVDAEFRVKGVENLRVVDLSVLPYLLNCHPQSIAYLIGETAAEKMIAEYGLS